MAVGAGSPSLYKIGHHPRQCRRVKAARVQICLCRTVLGPDVCQRCLHDRCNAPDT